MLDKFKAGDATEWNSHGGMGRGKVKKKLASRTLIKGHAVASGEGGEGAQADHGPDEREPQQLIDPAEQSDG